MELLLSACCLILIQESARPKNRTGVGRGAADAGTLFLFSCHCCVADYATVLKETLMYLLLLFISDADGWHCCTL